MEVKLRIFIGAVIKEQPMLYYLLSLVNIVPIPNILNDRFYDDLIILYRNNNTDRPFSDTIKITYIALHLFIVYVNVTRGAKIGSVKSC